ncbi:MAG TPA: hypothetical protein EYN51_08245 [Flavobacteriales bacterium]|nr:hypothetical protein [Flavobacteriales bacterium]HIA11143.1 hypothetical protein [Flavobacteriales bacterium]
MIANKLNIIRIIVLALAINLPLMGYSQCKGFAKKKCLPELKPFIHNGQLNSTTLMQGESAELVMTFHAGQHYRVMICAQLEKVSFKMMDMDREILFNSEEESDAKSWDFNVNATQQMIILVSVPKAGKHEAAKLTGTLTAEGCVALLVGFKD